MTLSVFSQKDTIIPSKIEIPLDIAKIINKELIEKDYLKRVNLILNNNISLLLQNDAYKDTIINNQKNINNILKNSNILLENINKSQDIQINYYKELTVNLDKELKKEKKNVLKYKIGGIAISSMLLYLFITK